MDAIEALKTRKSIRKYTKDEVKKEDLTIILECGALAPTGYNKQPCVFVVIEDEIIKRRITQIHPYSKATESAYYIIAIFSNFEEPITPVEDACAAAENMMIAATALGYGTCWLQAYDQPWALQLEELLKAPNGYRIVNLVTLGCYEDTGKRAPKKPLEALIRYNTF